MATEDFRRIFESLRIPVAGADAAGAIAFVNAAFVELAGPRDGGLPGIELASLFAAADRQRLQQNIARVGEGKSAFAHIEARLARDESRWASVALQPWLDSRDNASGVIAIVQDIGAQRETEAALNLAIARLLAIAEASSVATMVETASGDIEVANEAFCRLLGIESAPQSLSGVAVDEALARSPHLDVAALERHPVAVDDAPAGAVWTSREAAAPRGEKIAAQAALIEKIAQELSVAVEGLGTLSIRAQRADLDPAFIEHCQRIRESTETALAAVGDMVDFSRIAGSIVLNRRPFMLRACLAELIARIVPLAEERGGRLRAKVEQDVSDALEGDGERLQLVLRNLLDNALAVAPGGEVTLQVTPEYTTGNAIQLSFGVAVSGAAPAAAKASPEAGMGVAVAKFMVAAMGGKLAIASRAASEPLYAFTLEFAVRPAPPAPQRASHATLVAMPVLIVCANPGQRDSLAALMRGWRMLPLEADNAPMALALLERLHEEGSPVPLVILSDRLPVQDGFLLAFRIKNDARFAATLIMMLATEGKAGDAIACRENGVSAYMRYPVSDRQLNEAITAVTGACVDADATPTLVTRHSLREQRQGATVLLVDPSRDSQILAAHILGRSECSVVVAGGMAEAVAALDQDMYDMVLVDTTVEGLGGADAARLLRARIVRDPAATRIVAISSQHSESYREACLARGFDATAAKPFRREELLALVGPR
jgi:PAS domain S-box-containing protein